MSHGRKTHYEALGLEKEATLAEIKLNYRKLLLQFHPDKQDPKLHEGAANTYFEIENAWKVLSSPEKKQEYDAILKEMEVGQSAPFDVELELDEMFYDETTQAYSIECRCGGEYSITKGQIDTGYNVVPCTTCTLQAQVH